MYTIASTMRAEGILDTGAIALIPFMKCYVSLGSTQSTNAISSEHHKTHCDFSLLCKFYSSPWLNIIKSDLYKMYNKLACIRTLEVHFSSETQNAEQ